MEGGPNLRAEDVAACRAAGLDSGEIEGWWATAEAQRAEAEIEAARVAAIAELEAKTAREQNTINNNEAPRETKSLKDIVLAARKKETVPVISTPPPPLQAQFIIDLKAPVETARDFLAACHRGEIVTLQRWQREFWEWDGSRWTVKDDDTVRSEMYKFLEQCRTGERVLKEVKPDNKLVDKVMDALRSEVNLEPRYTMPMWLRRGELGREAPFADIRNIVACRNGLLDLETMELLDHSPRYWSGNVLEFDYDPRAKAPRFEQFLGELFPGDEEAQQTVLEVMGLCVTDETKYQKAWMFVGPKRSGKGTIGRVLRGLIGEENYAGSSMLAAKGEFAMQNWIGKKTIVFSDARLDGVNRREQSLIAGKLLNVTGEDPQEINRKFKGHWNGTLTARVIVMSNEVIQLRDDSGVLATRFITVQMRKSFAGKENHKLTEELLAERAGILNLALDALARMRERGKPLQPKSGLELAERLAEQVSEVMAFVRDECELGQGLRVEHGQLFVRFQAWCDQNEVHLGWASNTFSAKLRAAFPDIGENRPGAAPGMKRERFYLGIGLKGPRPVVRAVEPPPLIPFIRRI
jgi:putative DNA primase/helicase